MADKEQVEDKPAAEIKASINGASDDDDNIDREERRKKKKRKVF